MVFSRSSFFYFDSSILNLKSALVNTILYCIQEKSNFNSHAFYPTNMPDPTKEIRSSSISEFNSCTFDSRFSDIWRWRLYPTTNHICTLKFQYASPNFDPVSNFRGVMWRICMSIHFWSSRISLWSNDHVTSNCSKNHF